MPGCMEWIQPWGCKNGDPDQPGTETSDAGTLEFSVYRNEPV
eukprot:CAMPEP_0168262746 /NCGR_PEP_ID=MMETSP0141_2-20121125/9928_1 /TAXON_ID=44445 /ORGANISM="Pseudo-nitzschia australis, Strain 10249 10 AB" /LENGTH=41 /DNA_ID= /DNA_START= /DNA_END= /DNA_ORIENTATION=